ncbi:cytochrome C oxidase subunit IV family protein [Geomonas sp. Red32]|uniref:cytochrome C oxidase subunit IV family protein n=1 Tax=Geomonas sp. Red32 TaxID=2912856 RepID=UPI00202CADAD|nr:cytochrome C oxidase subunit IV family protein [Geomonas sp. Red32]MCM0084171.1 cytochrome C oxidase subunit IV family protein [Geomonas sp. Red32]
MSDHDAHKEGSVHIVSYGQLVAVWVSLLLLTVTTVAVTRVDLGAGKVWAALAIACVKSGLVIAFFMHMKYEARLFRIIFFVALVTLAVFIGLTFFDVLYR